MSIFEHMTSDLDDSVSLESQTPVSNTDQLPELHLNQSFESLQQKWNMVQETQSLIQHLKECNGISQESAKTIDTLKPGFLNDRRKIQQYTKTPSQIFYPDAIQFLNIKLSQEQLEVAEGCKVFFEEPLEELKQFQHHFKKYYRDNNLEQVLMLKTQYSKLFQNYETSQNFTVPSKDGFVNLMKTKMTDIPVDNLMIEEHGHLVKGFIEGIKAINTALSSSSMQLFISGIHEDNTLENMLLNSCVLNDITLETLIRLYRSNKVETLLDNLESAIDVAVDKLCELQKEVCDPPFTVTDFYQNFNEFLTKNHQSLHEIFTLTEFAQTVLKRNMVLHAAMKQTFPLLQALV